jgi:exo-1,4-beta-D-glucosaminidase
MRDSRVVTLRSSVLWLTTAVVCFRYAACGGDATPPHAGVGDDAGSNTESDGGYGDDAFAAGDGSVVPPDPSHVELTDWMIQSSAVATDPGATISTSSYSPTGWYPTKAPSTVLASLVANGKYGDVLTGMNFRSVPGTTYPIGVDFLTTQDVPPDSPFAPGWWFRTTFATPSSAGVTLHFEGISYRASIFLNGQPIASSADVAGTFRRWDFDVTKALAPAGDTNTLAVEVTAQTTRDLGLDFVDWNPAPADRYMGLLQSVYLVKHGGMEIRDPFVATHLQGSAAALTVGADLHNGGPAAVSATLKGTIGASPPITFSQDVTLPPGATQSVTFDPSAFAQLNVQSPKLWWPAKLGGQDLYTLDLQLVASGQTLHEQQIPFGIREITSELSNGARLFSINGKRILIRGAGYTPDILYREDPAKRRTELEYVLDLNLNTVRLEGKFESESFFDLADRMGILVMPGLMCCDYWQQSGNWSAGDLAIAQAAVHDQAMRLRKHPSVLTFLYGSDVPPVAKAEQAYLTALTQAAWPNPTQAAASEAPPAPLAGPTGIKMRGPYDYEPPIYWYTDTGHGGAFGFASEISPGPSVPPVESLEAMLGPGHTWPIDATWSYHAGARDPFQGVDNFAHALAARYGDAADVGDFANKSQLMAYESQRAMFEAYSRNKYASATGVIQWMLNNAWPGLIWHLYDYYLRPAGAYFGAKKGNEVLHVQYSYDDQSIVVVNHLYAPQTGLKVTATLYDLQSAQVFSQAATVSAGADAVTPTGIVLPPMDAANPVYFLQLEMGDASGGAVSSNFYWLTPQPDVMAQPDPSSAWYFIPIATFADFTKLATLQQATVSGSVSTQTTGDDGSTTVTLQNGSPGVAFFVRLQLMRGGSEVLPVLWTDNYISLPPGGKKTVTARYAAGMGDVSVRVSGWNVGAGTL